MKIALLLIFANDCVKDNPYEQTELRSQILRLAVSVERALREKRQDSTGLLPGNKYTVVIPIRVPAGLSATSKALKDFVLYVKKTVSDSIPKTLKKEKADLHTYVLGHHNYFADEHSGPAGSCTPTTLPIAARTIGGSPLDIVSEILSGIYCWHDRTRYYFTRVIAHKFIFYSCEIGASVRIFKHSILPPPRAAMVTDEAKSPTSPATPKPTPPLPCPEVWTRRVCHRAGEVVLTFDPSRLPSSYDPLGEYSRLFRENPRDATKSSLEYLALNIRARIPLGPKVILRGYIKLGYAKLSDPLVMRSFDREYSERYMRDVVYGNMYTQAQFERDMWPVSDRQPDLFEVVI